jgi:hypothetical protein
VGREDQIAFMAGELSAWGPYDAREFIKGIEAAKERGASYYLVSFSRNEAIIRSMRRFAKEVMPSFE